MLDYFEHIAIFFMTELAPQEYTTVQKNKLVERVANY